MKNLKSIHIIPIVLVLICFLTLSFQIVEKRSNLNNKYINHEKKLIDPANVRVGKVSLDKFLKIYEKMLGEVLKDMSGNYEQITEKLDLLLRTKGFNIQYLKEEDLANVDFGKRDLRFLNLKEANLKGASFVNAKMKFANIKEAYLEDADFTEANLENSNIKEATLINANFLNADLTGANLKEANVEGTNFKGANLSEVDIHEANGLRLLQLLNAKSLYKTHLPDELYALIKMRKPALLK
ncbi:pentapeptide repeat-containing protein [Bacteroidota bacterium]